MMKRALTSAVLLSALSVSLAPLGYAADQTKPSATRGTTEMRHQQPVMLGANYEAKKLIGMNVKNDKGNTLGEIKNLIIDPSGRVTYAVLEAGGVAGVGGKLYAVPWDRVHLSTDRKHVTLNVANKNQLSSEFSAFEEKSNHNRSNERK